MGASTIKWTTPNSFVPFKRARTWNWKLKWHANIAQNLWFNHIFDFYNIIYIFEFYNLSLYIYPRVIGKKIAYLKFYNLFIYQFEWWSKTM
jgi:hypothetical protein